MSAEWIYFISGAHIVDERGICYVILGAHIGQRDLICNDRGLLCRHE